MQQLLISYASGMARFIAVCIHAHTNVAYYLRFYFAQRKPKSTRENEQEQRDSTTEQIYGQNLHP